MKNRNVTLEGTNIQLIDSIGELNDGIVMNEVAKPLTLQFCKIVGESKGDILDIGFGLGFSANFFYEMGVKSYTCIEINDDIYANAIKWAVDKPNVTILKGDWVDIIPTIKRKFDGIFMDTYGDNKEKYARFESYVKSIANEGCILSMWEYLNVRCINELNYITIPVHQNNYKLLLRPLHYVCWTYFFAGKFRKSKFYQKKNIIPEGLCKEIIAENLEGYKEDFVTATVDGIVHTRKVWIKKLKDNEKLFNILRDNFYPNNKVFSSDNLSFCKIIKYEVGCLHDRHLETDRYEHLYSEDQYVDSVVISLNSDYKGGEFLVYDAWVRGDRNVYSNTHSTTGDVIKFRPFQHSQTLKITEGVKYEIFIKIKKKEILEETKYLI